jgi:hypothetical protein
VKPFQNKPTRLGLSDKEKDAWGIPLLITDVDYDDNDEKILKDFLNQEQKCWIKQAQKIMLLRIQASSGIRYS